MFDFWLKDYKNIFKVKVIIKFYLDKHTFGLKRMFITKNKQTQNGNI